MLRVPCVGEQQKVGTDQSQASVRRRLVDHDLGARGIENARVYQVPIHIVKAHGAGVGAAHAAELKSIALRFRNRDIFEALGRFPDDLDQGARIALLLRRWLGCRAGMCAWASCAKAHNKLALKRASVVRQTWMERANCLTLATNVWKLILRIEIVSSNCSQLSQRFARSAL